MNEDTPAGMRTLAHAVRTLRGVAGLTQEQLGRQIGYSRSQVNDVEHGRVWPHSTFATGCDAAFKTGTLFAGLHEQGREQKLPSWAVALPERQAVRIRSFQPSVVPGLLQTQDYARAMFNAGLFGDGDDAELQRRVDRRLARQEILGGQRLKQYHLILDESVLSRIIGTHEVMVEQMRHLLDAMHRRLVAVQLLPFASGAYPTIGPMTIFDLEDGSQAVHLEAAAESQTTSKPRTIHDCTNQFDMLRSQAASLPDSAQIIKARIEELVLWLSTKR